MSVCLACPRKCNIERSPSKGGFCRCGSDIKIARAALHHWEEPCISGTRGSGTIFFSGCNLRCTYCQNSKISKAEIGKAVSVERLREIFFELFEQGAHNINLVTPSHYIRQIAQALKQRPPIPIVYNSSGYDSVEELKQLEGLVDIYLPDLKYSDSSLSQELSNAGDYPQTALLAIKEMYRQTGGYRFDENSMLTRGVMIRHLQLPSYLENTLGVIDMIDSAFPKKDVLISFMSQYTPCSELQLPPRLRQRLSAEEYQRAVDYLWLCGFENGYVQELSSAEELYIPPFDLSGT